MAGWDDPMGKIRELEREVSRLREELAGRDAALEALAAEWDSLSKGETGTTRRLRGLLGKP